MDTVVGRLEQTLLMAARPFRVAAVVAASAALIACGGDDASDSSATTRAVSETTSASSPATTASSTTLPATGPVRMASTHYPYSLTLSAEFLTRPFQPAARAWDGEGTIAQASPYVDVVFTTDGVLHIFGVEWEGDLESLARMFADRQARVHGCSAELDDRREVMVAETPALAFIQGSCGPDAAVFARMALLHEGFGLIVFTGASAGQESAAIDELVTGMAGLEWT